MPISAGFPIITRSGVNEEGEELTYVFNYSLSDADIFIDGDNKDGYKDIISGKSYVKGDKIKVEDWDLVVLKKM